MQAWWWRSVAACASVLVLAGLVAVLAGAVSADRATSVRLAAEEGAATGAPPPVPADTDGPGPTDPPPTASEPGTVPATGPAAPEDRVVSADAGAGVVAAGWQSVTRQDVIEVPAGRFDAVLSRGEDAVVLVGRVDPDRVPDAADAASADLAALEAEARRLADAYAEILAPDADEVTAQSDDDRAIAGLPTYTSVRRVAGSGADDGAIVRVSTVAAPGRTVALMAVARPGPTQGSDATEADAVVRSLRLDAAPVAAPEN